MAVYAAVMTGKGTGAIATIQVWGPNAPAVVAKIFKQAKAGGNRLEVGQVRLGAITDGDDGVDQVTAAREPIDTFAINCHGNPIIVEAIMDLLRRHGVTLVSAEQFLTKAFTDGCANTIELEAKLAQLKAKTIQGTKLIQNQIRGGLSETANTWLKNIDRISVDQIARQAGKIILQSKIAGLIIHGCTIVLVGPVNTGKSTLLNYLAGRQKAIVADVAGTTRDWVQGQCTIGPLSLTLIDTAGLQQTVAAEADIARAAQRKTIEMLERAEVLLLVLDSSRPTSQIAAELLEMLRNRKVVTVLNKSDLPCEFDIQALPDDLRHAVRTSAKFGTGIDDLKQSILRVASVADFTLDTPIAFTDRQGNLLERLTTIRSSRDAASITTELLRGSLRV